MEHKQLLVQCQVYSTHLYLKYFAWGYLYIILLPSHNICSVVLLLATLLYVFPVFFWWICPLLCFVHAPPLHGWGFILDRAKQKAGSMACPHLHHNLDATLSGECPVSRHLLSNEVWQGRTTMVVVKQTRTTMMVATGDSNEHSRSQWEGAWFVWVLHVSLTWLAHV